MFQKLNHYSPTYNYAYSKNTIISFKNVDFDPQIKKLHNQIDGSIDIYVGRLRNGVFP